MRTAIIVTIIAIITIVIFHNFKKNNHTDTIKNNKSTDGQSSSETTDNITPKKNIVPGERGVYKDVYIFPDTETGNLLYKIYEFYNFIDSPQTEKGKLAINSLQALKKTPRKSFSTIKENISKIPYTHELQKQFFIQFACILDINKEEKLNFLDELLTEHKINYNPQSKYTYSVIFDSYIKVSQNPEEIEQFLLKNIDPVEPDIKKLFINSFHNINPAKTKELIEKYNL